jgi:uncharacterized protein (TIGR02231 family)
MTSLTTAITAVTVYPDRARLTRGGSLTLQPGAHLIEVADLPLQINPDSVRAAAHGAARARLLGVQVQRTYFTETPAEAARQLEEQIEALQDNLKQLDAQTEHVKHYRTLLDLLSGHTETYATALAARESDVQQQLALFDGLRARAEALDAETQSIAKERRTVERRLQKLQNELNQQRSARPRERYTATVEIEALQGGELTIELTYVVSGAGWKPLYDLRLLEEGEQPVLEVGYLAQVSQQTSEAWENVALTLSTARPALTGKLPELEAWYIQPRPLPPPQPVRAKARLDFQAVAAAPAAAPIPEGFVGAALEEVEAEAATASVDSSGAAVTYAIPATVTVPADGAPHKVTVARVALPPKLDYVTAPKLVEAAYRRAKVVNDSPYLLLPGAVNLFAGDEFIGATGLELTAPQGEIELYLGVDDRLKVERELKRREVDKRFLGGRRVTRYGYEITLENLLPMAARMTLHDQLPVARHEEIKVRLEAADPKPTEHTELNLLNWELTLAPKEKRVIRFDFMVDAPQGMEVIGLP